jgi:hypothetical protein
MHYLRRQLLARDQPAATENAMTLGCRHVSVDNDLIQRRWQAQTRE